MHNTTENNCEIPAWFEKFIEIKTLTYYKIGGLALYVAKPRNLQEIQQTFTFARKNSLPIAVLGAGTNTIFSDKYFKGIVLTLVKFNNLFWENPETLFVESGVINSDIPQACLAKELTGAEWMLDLPGQIGATIRMNARCYGGEISQLVTQVFALDAWGHFKAYSHKDIFLGYKSTYFMKNPELIVGARLQFLNKSSTSEIESKMSEVRNSRIKNSHFLYPSCGSTFKNNYTVGIPSGKIFDELGFKGKSIGGAQISEGHANFIWNKDNATAVDVLTLAAEMRLAAIEKAKANLELEVQPIGKFSQELFEKCGMEALGPSNFELDQAEHEKWVGLLWSPNEKINIDFPNELVSSSFLPYFGGGISEEKKHLLKPVYVSLVQEISIEHAKKQPDIPFITWITKTENIKEFSSKPPILNMLFMDNLWIYSVSELFLASPGDGKKYMEFELTPNLQWLALEFDGIRKRNIAYERPQANQWEHLKLFSKKGKAKEIEFGLSLPYSKVKDFIKDKKILFQCCLNIAKNEYYLAPYWGKVSSEENPDFHQTNKYFELNLD